MFSIIGQWPDAGVGVCDGDADAVGTLKVSEVWYNGYK